MIYFEQRQRTISGTDSRIADVMRHLHTRQHLGKATVVCGNTQGTLGTARKQWLRLTRSLQTQRARTLNADKILKFTHSITRMQRMHFSRQAPISDPEGDIFFTTPSELNTPPVHCFSLYLLEPLGSKVQIAALLDQLPSDSLIIDYNHKTPWETFGLQSKKQLEARVTNEWKQVNQYLSGYNIDINSLMSDGIQDVDAIDDALDTLLGVSHQFLQVADSFQHALELARPIRLSRAMRENYDSLILLAHRVQALSPGNFAKHFLEVYNNEDDVFLMRGLRHIGRLGWTPESVTEAIAHHTQANRNNLVAALSDLFANKKYPYRRLQSAPLAIAKRPLA